MKTLRAIVCITLVAIYAVGLISMLFFSFSLGVILWVVSTLGGALTLYLIKKKEEEDPEEKKL